MAIFSQHKNFDMEVEDINKVENFFRTHFETPFRVAIETLFCIIKIKKELIATILKNYLKCEQRSCLCFNYIIAEKNLSTNFYKLISYNKSKTTLQRRRKKVRTKFLAFITNASKRNKEKLLFGTASVFSKNSIKK